MEIIVKIILLITENVINPLPKIDIYIMGYHNRNEKSDGT